MATIETITVGENSFNTATGVPIGTIISLMGTQAPTQYLACEGQTVDIAIYPDLANYFEAQFGTKNHFGGDGTTTFGIPDLRGEFLRGTGTNSHENQGSGANVGVHQDATTLPISSMDTNNKNIVFPLNNIENLDSSITPGGRAWITFGSNSDSLNGRRGTSRPTNTSVLYCIATKNIYVDARYDYSLDEKVVGTWIDSKPVYQKTIIETLQSGNARFVDANISNIDTIVDEKVIFYRDLAGTENTPDFIPPSYFSTTVHYDFGFRVDGKFFYNNPNNTTGKILVTVQYTKTTD